MTTATDKPTTFGLKRAPHTLYRYDLQGPAQAPNLFLSEYPVCKATKQGVWIDLWCEGLQEGQTFDEAKAYVSSRFRFVLLGCRKQYAYECKDKAWQSFKIRKKRQIEHLERQLALARIGYAMKSPESADEYVPLTTLPFQNPTQD